MLTLRPEAGPAPWYVTAPGVLAAYRAGPSLSGALMLIVALVVLALLVGSRRFRRPWADRQHADSLLTRIGRALRLDPYRPGGPLDPRRPR